MDGRLYDVVSDREAGVALESAITVSMEESSRETEDRPATAQDIEAVLGHVRSDSAG